MILVNKVLNALVTLGLVYIFYEAASNFWIALPYLLIYTAIIIPTIINNDSKYFSKLIDYIFENEWQSFRTRQDRTIELKSIFKVLPPGKSKVAVKVVDIFGNDTMKVITVTIGEKR